MDNNGNVPTDAGDFWVNSPADAPAVPSYGTEPPIEVAHEPGYSGAEILTDTGTGVAVPRKRTAIVASIAAVSVAAVAGASFAAYSVLGGGGTQPEAVLPANTVAMMKVDFDPSAGQKVALFQLLQKFPDTANLKDSDKSFGDWLVRRLSETSGAGAINFDTDVKPWLGQRFAFAVLPDSKSDAGLKVVVVLQETDEKAAKAALDKLQASQPSDKLAYAFMDGYVVVGDGNSAPASVVADAQASSLASNAQFSADVDALGSDEIVTAWADASKLGEHLKKFLAAQGGLGVPDLGAFSTDSLQGRYVLGMHATADSVELKTLVLGGKSAPKVAPVSALANSLPNSWLVLDGAGADQSIDNGWAALAKNPQLSDAITQFQDQFGLNLPADLKTLLGNEITVSVAGDPNSSPSIAAVAKTKDGAAAEAVLNKILNAAGADGGVYHRVDGNTLVVGTSQEAVDSTGKGTIAANPLFQQAVADPEQAQAIFFVDLTKVWASAKNQSDIPKEVQKISAVGVSTSASDGNATFVIRVIFK